MKILGIIPAKGKSRGLPNKNIRPLLGKPTIYYTIEHAKKSKYITRLVCSTEDKKIASLAKDFGVEVILRPESLAKDDTRIDDVLRHAVKELKKEFIPDAVVMLLANVPVRKEGIIDKAIEYFLKTKADAVISVIDVGQYNPNWFLSLDKEKKVSLPYPNRIYRRQDLPKQYTHDGAVLVVKTEVLMKNSGSNQLYPFLGNDIRAIVQDSGDVVDIDNEMDFYLAETILRKKS